VAKEKPQAKIMLEAYSMKIMRFPWQSEARSTFMGVDGCLVQFNRRD
jgi:hypothetical protein